VLEQQLPIATAGGPSTLHGCIEVWQDFLKHTVPVDNHSGVKVCLTAPTSDSVTLQGISWQRNPAGFYAHLMDMLVGWCHAAWPSPSIISWRISTCKDSSLHARRRTRPWENRKGCRLAGLGAFVNRGSPVQVWSPAP
jgi:hypothetical protein